MVEWCLCLGFNIRQKNSAGLSTLHLAARRGNYDIAVRILKAETEDGGGNIERLVNSRNNNGSTPLYAASKAGNARLVELLLDKYVHRYGNVYEMLP